MQKYIAIIPSMAIVIDTMNSSISFPLWMRYCSGRCICSYVLFSFATGVLRAVVGLKCIQDTVSHALLQQAGFLRIHGNLFQAHCRTQYTLNESPFVPPSSQLTI